MKTRVLFLLSALCVLAVTANAQQKMETFENADFDTDGTTTLQFEGTSGITYTVGNSVRSTNHAAAANTISGRGLLLRKFQQVNGWIEFPLANGVNDLKFYFVRGFDTGTAGIKVSLAGQEIEKFGPEETTAVDSVVFTNLNHTAATVLRIEKLDPNPASVIDSIVWTEPTATNIADRPTKPSYLLSSATVEGFIHLDIQHPFSNGSYAMYDALGRLIRQEIIPGRQTRIELPKNAAGIYILRLSIDGYVATEKIIAH